MKFNLFSRVEFIKWYNLMNFIQLIIVVIFNINCLAYLHISQTILINKLIQNNNLTPVMRHKINTILYYNYKNKTRSDVYIFHKKYYKLLKNIKIDVLNLYAQNGLFKSIKNFNGKSNFYNYSKIYVNAEMLQCISDHQHNILPHRLKSSNKISKYIKSKYNIMYFGSTNSEDAWKLDELDIKNYNKNDYTLNNQLLNIHIILNKLKPKIKRTFNLRYNYNLKKIRSISHVSELMCWSKEQTRLVLLDAINEIKLGLKNGTFVMGPNTTCFLT